MVRAILLSASNTFKKYAKELKESFIRRHRYEGAQRSVEFL